MLEITKRKTESGYNFTLDNGEHEFNISFAGNLDLYWTIHSKKLFLFQMMFLQRHLK